MLSEKCIFFINYCVNVSLYKIYLQILALKVSSGVCVGKPAQWCIYMFTGSTWVHLGMENHSLGCM